MRHTMKAIKKLISTTFLIALFGGSGYAYWWWNTGVSNREVRDTVHTESRALQMHVESESKAVQLHVDERCDMLDGRCDVIAGRCRLMDEQLDRIEEKLDTLIKLATAPQPLPDGMAPVAE